MRTRWGRASVPMWRPCTGLCRGPSPGLGVKRVLGSSCTLNTNSLYDPGKTTSSLWVPVPVFLKGWLLVGRVVCHWLYLLVHIVPSAENAVTTVSASWSSLFKCHFIKGAFENLQFKTHLSEILKWWHESTFNDIKKCPRYIKQKKKSKRQNKMHKIHFYPYICACNWKCIEKKKSLVGYI